jgi:hypothetical protein
MLKKSETTFSERHAGARRRARSISSTGLDGTAQSGPRQENKGCEFFRNVYHRPNFAREIEIRPGADSKLKAEWMMFNPRECILYSGGAAGAEAWFGSMAEKYGLQEVNFSFEGHQTERNRGLRVLTNEELALKDVSLSYVSKLMNRQYTSAPLFRKVLQSICWQVSSSHEIFVIGEILPDDTVKGGTGWGAEFSKICNKRLLVFDQNKNAWFNWDAGWVREESVGITERLFTGTGTRFINENGKRAVEELFARSFKNG